MAFRSLLRRLRKAKKTAGKTLRSSSFPEMGPVSGEYQPERAPVDMAKHLPPEVLKAIFHAVCPHAADRSYASSEDSMMEDVCMLCDMRDLAHCLGVCRSWSHAARKVLYQNIRIDPVHYCELEFYLSEKRKKSKVFNKGRGNADIPQQRLELLNRTLRRSRKNAKRVKSLRLGYMTREAYQGLLASIVAITPNLRYVDLPKGFFADDSASSILRTEVRASCPEMRWMSYRAGAENALVKEFVAGKAWPKLEVLEINNVRGDVLLQKSGMKPIKALRTVLQALPQLFELKLSNLEWLDNNVLSLPVSYESGPAFPPINTLMIAQAPKVTYKGIAGWLADFPERENRLKHLVLDHTGVKPEALQKILRVASSLDILEYIQHNVVTPFPMNPSTPIPPLISSSLRSLRFEVTSNFKPYSGESPAKTYYGYLLFTILARSLSSLRELYVADMGFSDALLFTPPNLRIPNLSGAAPGNRSSTMSISDGPNPLPLSVYCKGPDQGEWIFSSVHAPRTARGRASMPPLGSGDGGKNNARNSIIRPATHHRRGTSVAPGWQAEARKSMLVGDGVGGFCAVSQPELSLQPPSPLLGGGVSPVGKRPASSKSERADLFR